MGKDQGPEVVTRDYRPGDETEILKLFQRCFEHPLSEADPIETWKWFYLQNPGGRVFVKLAESAGRLAAQYAVIPVRMKIGDWTGLGSLSLHTMTDPDFRGLGLFTTLAKAIYADLEKAGLPLTYGFPNSESAHGITSKLGWSEPSPPPVHLFPLEPKRLLEARGTNWLAAGIGGALAKAVIRAPAAGAGLNAGETIQEVEDFGREFDSLWDAVGGTFPISAVRDRAFLEWRFRAKPGEAYEVRALRSAGGLGGYAVTKAGRIGLLSVVFIMDLLVKPPEERHALALVAEAVRRARDDGADVVTCMLPHWHPAAAALRKLRFIRLKPTQFPEEMHFGQRANGRVPGGASPEDPKSWYITWADSDVV